MPVKNHSKSHAERGRKLQFASIVEACTLRGGNGLRELPTRLTLVAAEDNRKGNCPENRERIWENCDFRPKKLRKLSPVNLVPCLAHAKPLA